ncbi:YtrH family sporulation protein [Halanaerocella petrolearia]
MKRLLIVFFTSLGVVLGGSILGSIGATLAQTSPLKAMLELAEEIKLWAVVTAIGGTFSNLKLFEGGILQGEFLIIIKQFILLVTAFLGAQLGIWLISILTGGS